MATGIRAFFRLAVLSTLSCISIAQATVKDITDDDIIYLDMNLAEDLKIQSAVAPSPLLVLSDDQLSGVAASSTINKTQSGQNSTLFNHAIDLNADKQADVVLRNTDSGQWVAYIMGGDDVIDLGYIEATNNQDWQLVDLVDINADGSSDLIVRNTKDGRWVAYLLDGKRIIGKGQIRATDNLNWEPLAVTDINNDGSADIIVRSALDGRWVAYMLNGLDIIEKGSINATTNLDWELVSTVDTNGDGASDLLLRHAITGQWVSYLLDGLAFVDKSIMRLTNNPLWEVASFADINGDKNADVLLRHRETGAWVAYTLDGISVLSGKYIEATSDLAWELVSMRDFNNDQQSDMLLRNARSGDWRIYQLNGHSILNVGHPTLTANMDWGVVSVEDMNADGKSDILLRNALDGRWVAYLMDGIRITSASRPQLTTNGLWQPVYKPLVKSQDVVYTIDVNDGYDIAMRIPFSLSIQSNVNGLMLTDVVWDMGDGTIIKNSASITHVYSRFGAKKINVEGNDENGERLSGEVSVDVGFYVPPFALFIGPFGASNIDEAITFDGSRSIKAGGELRGFYWDFGDGTTANEEEVEKIFRDVGTYDVSLTVTDNHKTTDTMTRKVRLTNGDVPFANIFTTTPYGLAPHEVDFRLFIFDLDSDAFNVTWDFGDGTVIEDDNREVSHIYEDPGNYSVVAYVEDEKGNKTSAIADVVVRSDKTFSVSAKVKVNTGLAIDSDINDGDNNNVSNNVIAQAQPLGVVGAIAGFVTAVPYDPFGNGQFADANDLWDVYLLDLEAGQRISLNVSDHATGGDLDLYLVNAENEEVVAVSESQDNLEIVTVPSSGQYYVGVYAFAGTSNYLVNTRYGGEQTQQVGSQVSFVENEVLGYKPIVKRALLNGALDSQNMRRLDNSISSIHRIATSSAQLSGGQGQSASHNTSFPIELIGAWVPDSMKAKLSTISALKSLSNIGLYKYVELNHYLNTFSQNNDPFTENLWHYNNINLTSATNNAQDNYKSTPIVAVIDSGVYLEHEDLKGNLVAGYDFVTDVENAGDGDGIDSSPNDPGPSEDDVNRYSWHGTHVAGTVGAIQNNEKGIFGVARVVKVMPVRAIGISGSAPTSDIVNAFRYAAGLTNVSNTVPQRHADVINLSLGGTSASASFQDSINEAREKGIIVVAAAGNAANSIPNYPAAYAGVVSVSATGFQNSLAPYSSYGESVDVAAPGGDISVDADNDGNADGVLSLVGESSYRLLQGTSMAAPHVAGVFALMKSVNPNLTPDDIDSFLQRGALTNDVGAIGKDMFYGYGLIDAAKAVQVALTGEPAPSKSSISLSTSTISLNTGVPTATFTIVSNQVAAAVSAVDVRNGDVFAVEASSVNDQGIGEYTISLKDGVEPGFYESSVLVADDNESEYFITVSALIFNSGDTSSVNMFAMLLNETTQDSAYTISGSIVNGELSVEFPDVVSGKYYILVGTDMDNDGFICDEGELCGTYPTLSRPALIDVLEGNVGNIVVNVLPSVSAVSGDQSGSNNVNKAYQNKRNIEK